MKVFKKKAHMEDMSPETIKFPLQETSGHLQTTRIPFLPSLYYQLTNPVFESERNILFDKHESPFEGPDDQVETFGDINTGSRYIESYYRLKKEKIDKPVGMITFGDTSVMNVGSGRNSTDMICYTLTTRNRKARYRADSWQSIGSVPLFKTTEHKNAEDKCIDYQRITKYLFEDIRELQNTKAGVLWVEKFKGKAYLRHYILYILVHTGDTPGLNRHAGKMEGNKCFQPCRSCTIPKEKLGDPWAEYKYVTKAEVNLWRKSEHDRKKYSYKIAESSIDLLCHGGDVHGIHGSSPGELGHALQGGIHKVVINGLFFLKALSEKGRKQSRKHASQKLQLELKEEAKGDDRIEVITKCIDITTENENESLSEEMLIKKGIFGGRLGQHANIITCIIGKKLRQQSDKDLPRTNFPDGITTRARLSVSHYQGLLLILLIMFSATWATKESPTSHSLVSAIGEEKINEFIIVFELLIGLEEITKNTRLNGIKKSDIDAIKYMVCMLIDRAKSACDYKQGMGFTRIKTHLLVKMLDKEVKKYGTPDNVSGMPGESQFKENFKLPGSTARKWQEVFDEDIYKRKHEHLVIERCKQINDVATYIKTGLIPQKKNRKEKKLMKDTAPMKTPK